MFLKPLLSMFILHFKPPFKLYPFRQMAKASQFDCESAGSTPARGADDCLLEKNMIAMSRFGISINYRCIYLRKPFEKKCPHRDTEKCFKCKYGVAELAAKDATKLLEVYTKQMTQERLKGEEKKNE